MMKLLEAEEEVAVAIKVAAALGIKTKNNCHNCNRIVVNYAGLVGSRKSMSCGAWGAVSSQTEVFGAQKWQQNG